MAKTKTGKTRAPLRPLVASKGPASPRSAPASGGRSQASTAGDGAAGGRPTPMELSCLTPDPQNARAHGARNIDTIETALREVGAARSLVIDEDGVVLAGNATLEAAKRLGMSRVLVVDGDGQTIVAVRRTGLSAAMKSRLALYDNRTAELADGWNAEVLRQLQEAGVNLDGLWTADELVELLGGSVRAGLTDPDDVPPLRATSVSLGDVFALGEHRLVCGDSTDPAAATAVIDDSTPLLMVTDPPYGVKYEPEWRRAAGVNNSARMGKVENDDRADWSEAWALFPGDVAYVWHAGLFASVVESSLRSCGFELRSQIIWRKERLVLSRGHYHWQHEPCWYAVRKGRTAHWGGKRNQVTAWPIAGGLHRCQSCGAVAADAPIEAVPSSVWDIESSDATGETTHGTQKPVECMARAMRNHHAPIVYEPFCGSGSSLIAAEMLARSCRAIELSPQYVQQIIDRWESFTGLKARKSGETYGREAR